MNKDIKIARRTSCIQMMRKISATTLLLLFLYAYPGSIFTFSGQNATWCLSTPILKNVTFLHWHQRTSYRWLRSLRSIRQTVSQKQSVLNYGYVCTVIRSFHSRDTLCLPCQHTSLIDIEDVSNYWYSVKLCLLSSLRGLIERFPSPHVNSRSKGMLSLDLCLYMEIPEILGGVIYDKINNDRLAHKM